MKKKDKFYYKAKKENIRARSYYKLKEIDEKFNLFRILNTNKLNKQNLKEKNLKKEEQKNENKEAKQKIDTKKINIIDLGCAPGAWLQYINSKIKNLKISKEKIKVIGIDLLEVKNREEFLPNIKIYQVNFLEPTFDKIIENEEIKKFDIILSDMAPEFTGQKERDFYNTYLLNKKVIEFSSKYLKKNGRLVFKTFQNQYTQELIELLKKELKIKKENIKFFKPKSSKKESPEIYIVVKY